METKKLTPEILALLKEPLSKEAIKQHPTKKYLSTIKAIYVVERLNECFGIGGWKINNEVVEKKEAWVIIKSTLTIPEYGIIVPDIFGGNDNPDPGDAYKGACTDALTKIGSYLGIGMDVYKGLTEKPPYEKPARTNLTPKLQAWEKAVTYLKGTGTIESIKEKYDLSPENEELLKQAVI